MSESMPRPKVLVVVHSLEVGGAEVVAVALAESLQEHFQFDFACLDQGGPLADRLGQQGISVRTLGRSTGFDRRLVGRLRSTLEELQPALVHTHQCTPWIYAQFARLPSAKPPLLVTEHGRFHPDSKNPKHILANRLLMRSRDRAVAVGEGVKVALADNEGIPARRVSVIYNGVDLAAFEGRAAKGRELIQEFGLSSEDRVALFVARLDSIKDHDTALRAMSRLRDSTPQLKLFIVGEGPEAERIDQRIAQLNLSGSVKRLGLRSDVPDLLAASDILVLTSVSEGIPLCLIEAMASRVPIVSTEVGGVGEVVGDAALLVPAGNDSELAEALARLVREPELGTQLAERGRQRAEESFALEAMARRYRALYDEMIRGGT